MNDSFAFPAKETTTDPATILVWDAPVRVFHWLMVFSFAGACLSAESERWRLLHVGLGYTMAGLVVFRILWGWQEPAMPDSPISCVAPGLWRATWPLY